MMAARAEVDSSWYLQHQKVFQQISESPFEEIHPADQHIMPSALSHFYPSLPMQERI